MIDILFVIGICALVSAVSVVFLLIIRRKIGHAELAKHNDVAGFIYAVIGVIYAVLLAFVVIVEWEIFRETKSKIEAEVSAMASIFRDSRVFNDFGNRTFIQSDLMIYATTVIDEEWPMLANGKSSEKALDLVHRVFKHVAAIQPQNDYEKIWYQELISKVNDFSNARNERILCSTSGIPAFMWWVMILGGVITIGFSFLFGTGNTTPHVLMVVSLSTVITLVMLMIYALDHPFKGIITVTPEAFVEQLAHWKGYAAKGF
nr:DUF4239 domain-containing protein [Chlorobium sp. KB01]